MEIWKNSLESSGANEKEIARFCCRFAERKAPAFGKYSVKQKSRAELLSERKARLIQIAESAAPDVHTPAH